MLDYEVQQRLIKLLESATNKNMPSVEADSMKEIKALARTSNEYILSAHDVLMERMKVRHAQVLTPGLPLHVVLRSVANWMPLEHVQVRLLSVEICDELFMRSKVFRDLVSASFDKFLQSAVGYSSKDPLPGPADCAENLRTRALAVIQRWENAFGLHYPQASPFGFHPSLSQ